MYKQPNILLITTDQQRYDTVGERAPEYLRTPHLDQLAYEGVTFNNAYSDCPVCVPARVSIMNGKFVSTHGMYGNGPSSNVLGRDDTLPGLLRQAGYQTAAIGKMHFGPQRSRHGFEEMILPDDYYRWMRQSGNSLQPMRHGLGQNEIYPTMATVPEPMTLTSWTAEQCVDYIRDRRDPAHPFFLWCSFSKPHPPLDPPEPYYSMYPQASIELPAYPDWCDGNDCPPILRETRMGMKHDRVPDTVWQAAKSAYYGLITQIDYNIGRVLAALNEVGLYEDTLILFTSDHGELLGDLHAGGKCYAYEGSAHVPFILRLPRQWEERHHGETISTPITHADILPTLIEAGGGNVPEDVDGIDLVSLVRGNVACERKYVVLFGGANVRSVAIADGTWKYVWYPQGAVEQLFNVDQDPGELSNRAADPENREIRETLKSALIAELKARNSDYVDGDTLVTELVGEINERDLRNGCGMGLITDQQPADVRH